MVMLPRVDSRGRHQSGNVNRVQVRGKHRHSNQPGHSPGQQQLAPSSPLATNQPTLPFNETKPASTNSQPQTSTSQSSRTNSPASSNSKEKPIAECVIDPSKNLASISSQSKLALPSSASSTMNESAKETTKLNKEKVQSKGSDNSNKKKDPLSEKENASTNKATKIGNKIKAFDNVTKSAKKSSGRSSTTMDEKEISVNPPPAEIPEDEPTKTFDKGLPTPKLKKDRNATTPSISTKSQSAQNQQKTDMKMTRRPRRDSNTSSLAAAMQVKAQKDDIGNHTKRHVDHTSNTATTLASSSSSKKLSQLNTRQMSDKLQDKEIDVVDTKKSKVTTGKVTTTEDESTDSSSTSGKGSDAKQKSSTEKDGKSITRKMATKAAAGGIGNTTGNSGSNKKKPINSTAATINLGSKKEVPEKKVIEHDIEKQYLSPNDVVEVGDRIKVFYKREIIYPAKVIQVQEPKNGEKWPRYRVHYDGWNKRYDEWIKRSKIAEFNSEKERPGGSSGTGGPPGSSATDGDSEPTSPPSRDRKDVSRKDSAISTTSSSSASSHKMEICTSSTKKKAKIPNDRIELENLSSKDIRGSRSAKLSKLAGNEKEANSSPRAGTPSSLRSSRTNSPVSHHASLKRQNSRGSLKKDTDESEAEVDRDVEEVMSSSDSAGGTGGRKSSRLQRGQPQTPAAVADSPSNKRVLSRRSDRKRTATVKGADESETDDNMVKDDEGPMKDKDVFTPTKGKRGRKGLQSPMEDSESEDSKDNTGTTRRAPSREKNKNARVGRSVTTTRTTPVKGNNESDDQDEDPYDFKEPEPFDHENILVKFEPPRKGQSSDLPTTLAASSGKKLKDEKDLSADIAEGDSANETKTSATATSDEGTISDEEKQLNMTVRSTLQEEDPLSDISKRNNSNDSTKKEDAKVKTEGEDSSDVGKPVLQYTKKQQELFPHLAAIRTTSVPGISTRGEPPGLQANPANNASTNLPKASNAVSHHSVPSHSLPASACVGGSVASSNTKQKQTSEISTQHLAGNKFGPSSKTDLITGVTTESKSDQHHRSRSRSPKNALNIFAENILAAATQQPPIVLDGEGGNIPPTKKPRRKPTKPSSSELVESESDSDNDDNDAEDVEADGDVDSNGDGEDSVFPRLRQQQQMHRKRSSASRATSSTDHKKDQTNSSASSNDSSPNKNSNLKTLHQTSSSKGNLGKGKSQSCVSGITPTASKRKRDLEAASETTESDEEELSNSRGQPHSSIAKQQRGATSLVDKSIKRQKKDNTNTLSGEPDDLDLACGETIPGSPVHPGTSGAVDAQHVIPDGYQRGDHQPRGVSNKIQANASSIQAGPAGGKSAAQTASDSSSTHHHHSSASIAASNTNQGSINRLEMPFASVPESVHGPSSASSLTLPKSGHINGHANVRAGSISSAVKGKQYSQGLHRDADMESLQGYSSTSQSPTHDSAECHSRSKSPNEQGIDPQGDSSEVDMDSLSGRGAGSGADSGSLWPGEGKSRGAKRKIGDHRSVSGSGSVRGSHSPAAGSRSPMPSSGPPAGKRKKRSRKTSVSGQGGSGRGKNRNRHGSGRNASGMTPNRGGGEDDSDEDDEGGNVECSRPQHDNRQSTRISSLGSLDNDALAALSQRSPRTSKFNFYVQLGML